MAGAMPLANAHESHAQPQAVPSVPLPTAITDKMSRAGLSGHEMSVWIKPVGKVGETGEQIPLINHLADTPRTPASTQKLITTAIALDLLGADYHWQTRLYADGVVVGDTLYGNLIIKGSGDPSLTHDRLSAMFSQLTARGVRHIKGDIIVDNTGFVNVAQDVNAFDGQGLRAYNAQPNAFLINFGTLEVSMIPSGTWVFGSGQTTGQDVTIGEPVPYFRPTDGTVAVQVLPKLADFHAPTMIQGDIQSCRTKPKFGLSADTLTITGQVGVSCGQASEWLTFADSEAFITRAVKGTWQALDKDFVGQVRLRQPYDGAGRTLSPLLSFASKPLSEQVYQINQYSNNVMTEQVALSLPLMMGQKTSDYPKSFALINTWWQQHLTTPAPIMSRASGLCRDCVVAPRALGELLAFSQTKPTFETFKASLPIVGQTGTMATFARRRPHSPAIGRAFIKTGRLNNVASIAGYVMGQSGKMYVVVAIINADGAGNNTHAHDVLDEVIEWTAGQS
ncbi:hypothetical protein A9Z63_06785 [Moraxella lacunata]|uniref:Serine-type D-Ala-D-Ala carboxypeptidase n=3 Tax=Moraxellaceae TaxID=468 RepID=A0A1B8Q8D7_MORLA|nr:hypothetical protein A9Z63_06785 [Moraxella lacunata]OBX67392.1 hypothetical protein A9309_00250 [Moraxella lacunata]